MTTGVFATVDRDKIDEVYKLGLVKPNEYESIRDNLIERELFLRHESLSYKLELFYSVLLGWEWGHIYYFLETGYSDLKTAILDLAYNDPEKLLIEADDIRTLVLADVAYNKAVKVRDLGDVNRSDCVTDQIIADKETIRSLEYLIRYKRGLWDLLDYLKTEEE